MNVTKLVFVSLFLLGVVAPAGGQALSEPERIVVEPGQVARATCSLFFHCLVTLPEGEEPTGGIVGDGGRWEVSDYRQGRYAVLSVRPKECGVETSMSILTNAGGAYELLLTSEPCDEGDLSPVGRSTRVVFKGRSTATGVLTFSAEPLPAVAEASAGTAGPEFFLGTRGGYGWEKKRRFPAKPLAIFSDDGRTYIYLEKGALAPAVFGVDEEGKERIVDFQVYGDWVVVNERVESGILRVGAGPKSDLLFSRSR